MGRLSFHVPDHAWVEEADVASGVGLTLGEEPRAVVRAVLVLRPNGSTVHVQVATALSPDAARDVAKLLNDAADAADEDLARYLTEGWRR